MDYYDKKSGEKMKPSLILITLLLSTCPVWGCESYEECMKEAETAELFHNGQIVDRETHQIWAMEEMRLRNKAIAFKLDEISKKLDKPNASN